MKMRPTNVPNIKGIIIDAIRTQQAILITITAYTTAALLLSLRLPANNEWILVIAGVASTVVVGPLFLLCAYTIYVMAAIRPARLTQYLLLSIRQYMTRERLLHALPLLILFPFFTAAFTYFKSAIPLLHPFSWDERFSHIDLTLHGGMHPWVWLQPIVGYPAISSAINILYHLWFFIIYATVYWLTFAIEKSALRMRFLLSFVLCWILLGNVLAGVFSSAGPCYYGQLLPGEDPYRPLMEYLHEAGNHFPLWALEVQKMLWNDYQSHTAALGISAMPSLHVATSVLLALLGIKLGRVTGITMTIFAIIIMIGSVHLGWHYALDGYIGAIGAYLIWHAVGWLLSKTQKLQILHSRTQQPAVLKSI